MHLLSYLPKPHEDEGAIVFMETKAVQQSLVSSAAGQETMIAEAMTKTLSFI